MEWLNLIKGTRAYDAFTYELAAFKKRALRPYIQKHKNFLRLISTEYDHEGRKKLLAKVLVKIQNTRAELKTTRSRITRIENYFRDQGRSDFLRSIDKMSKRYQKEADREYTAEMQALEHRQIANLSMEEYYMGGWDRRDGIKYTAPLERVYDRFIKAAEIPFDKKEREMGVNYVLMKIKLKELLVTIEDEAFKYVILRNLADYPDHNQNFKDAMAKLERDPKLKGRAFDAFVNHFFGV